MTVRISVTGRAFRGWERQIQHSNFQVITDRGVNIIDKTLHASLYSFSPRFLFPKSSADNLHRNPINASACRRGRRTRVIRKKYKDYGKKERVECKTISNGGSTLPSIQMRPPTTVPIYDMRHSQSQSPLCKTADRRRDMPTFGRGHTHTRARTHTSPRINGHWRGDWTDKKATLFHDLAPKVSRSSPLFLLSLHGIFAHARLGKKLYPSNGHLYRTGNLWSDF